MPPSAPAILTEALIQHRAGRLDEAEALYRQALSQNPRHADALHLLGMIFQQTGRPEAAIQAIRHAIEVSPVTPHYHLTLGNLFGEQNRLADAIACFDRAIALKPDLAEAHNNRGTALVRLGYREKADNAFAQAIAHRPDFAEALNNRANVLRDLGRPADAVAVARQALALHPTDPEAYFHLGNALGDQGDLDAAATSYETAIALTPGHARALNNLGNIRKQQGRPGEALTHYARAVASEPDDHLAHSNLLFCLNYLPDQSPTALRDGAAGYGAQIATRVTTPYTTWQAPGPDQPIRVGFVSSDLRAHPVGFFLESLIRAADPTRVAFFAFPSRRGEDATTARLKPWFAGWLPIHDLDDAAAAERIHAAEIHILIDLSGHTADNRLPLFVRRPAPIQATWLGYFATTGLAAIDFIIADPIVVPSEEAHHFTETVWRLPDIYLCFTPPEPDIPVADLPSLTNGYVTFGCFNNLTKVNDAVVAVWSKILLAVPESRLMLKASQLANPAVRANIIHRFANYGIAAERLLIEPPSPRGDYLRAYNRIDIALDPFPYPGGTTSFEALWMGVPVLTKRGDRFLSRAGETISRNAGLPDWIAENDTNYVERAVRFAADRPALAALRARLRSQVLASPLFDAGALRRPLPGRDAGHGYALAFRSGPA